MKGLSGVAWDKNIFSYIEFYILLFRADFLQESKSFWKFFLPI